MGITIENLDLSNTCGGVVLLETENSTISNNTVCNNNWGGILLYNFCGNNTITGNNVSNNNEEGIFLTYSSNNTITGNNVSNNDWSGIRLDDSSNNSITSNVFVNDGLSVRDSYHNAVEDNIVNGKPLAYLENASDYRVEDAGQVILVNCNNITVENQDLSNTSRGIALWKTENSKISNNTVCNNFGGIRIKSSGNNTITGNNVSSNGVGICLYYFSNNNTITGNNVCNNNKEGIRLGDSSNNTITGNNVCNNNKEGIRLGDSSKNKIYFNNLINNTDNVDSYKSTNIWNSTLEITYTYDGTTYKSYLGNYCDDYEGTDADGDGIGDTHYSIDSKSDYYPLMTPFENYYITTSAYR